MIVVKWHPKGCFFYFKIAGAVMVFSFDMATGGSLEQKRQRWEPANHIHTQSKENLL